MAAGETIFGHNKLYAASMSLMNNKKCILYLVVATVTSSKNENYLSLSIRSNDSSRISDGSNLVQEIQLMNQIDPSKITILVVNDNFPLLNMLADMLEDEFDVKTANNGLEALDMVIAYPRNFFDAIVLDINMPIMDGFETFEKI